MIGFLRGKVMEVEDEYLLLEVNGVGYKVYATTKLLEQLQPNLQTTKEIALYIETIVKEDAITLYGFADKVEQMVFNQLINISGLGKKFALRILGALEPVEIFMALEAHNEQSFSNISGIGAKLAQRIINDLKGNKVLKGLFANYSLVTPATANPKETKTAKGSKQGNDELMNNKKVFDAVSALENLGYKHHEVFQVVKGLQEENPAITLETLITESLKHLN